ncbi:hypothetical protein M1N59_02130 [Dehalococcoidales bacterium]|nr:hypothetical protein [Dehalococcoidales bacterium]
MKKVSISLERGQTHRKVGLAIYEDAGDEELRRVIELIQESLAKHFPSATIARQKAVRELFGE